MRLAEDVIDHVSYGLTRREHIREIASMIEEAYTELVTSAGAVLAAQGENNTPELRALRHALRHHFYAEETVDPSRV